MQTGTAQARQTALLQDTRTQVTAAFDRLSGTLDGAQEALSLLGSQVARLGPPLKSFAETALQGSRLGETCSAVANALEAEVTQMARTDLGTALTDTLAPIDGMGREARQLTVVATMTRITANSMGMSQINAFVDSLRLMTAELASAGDDLARGIRTIAAAQRTARTTLGGAAVLAAQAHQTAAGAMQGRAHLHGQHDTQNTVLSALESRLQSSQRDDTATLAEGVRFARSLAQRLANVQAILADRAAPPEALARLAAAQIAAIVHDAGSVQARLCQALAQMAAVGQQASEILAGSMGSEIETVLMALDEELEQGTRLQAALGPALAASLEAARQIRAQVTRAQDDLRRLNNTEHSITLAAVNARLLAARWGEAKAAMDVLSRTVQESAAACSIHAAACSAAVLCIEGVLDRNQLSAIEATANDLNQLIAAVRRQRAEIHSGLAGLKQLRGPACSAAQTLSAAVSAALHVLDTLPDAMSELAAQGRSLAAGPQPDSGQLARLAPLAARYTLQCERDVHAALCQNLPAIPGAMTAAIPISIPGIIPGPNSGFESRALDAAPATAA